MGLDKMRDQEVILGQPGPGGSAEQFTRHGWFLETGNEETDETGRSVGLGVEVCG